MNTTRGTTQMTYQYAALPDSNKPAIYNAIPRGNLLGPGRLVPNSGVISKRTTCHRFSPNTGSLWADCCSRRPRHRLCDIGFILSRSETVCQVLASIIFISSPGAEIRISAPFSSSSSLPRKPQRTPTAKSPAFFAVCISTPESPT